MLPRRPGDHCAGLKLQQDSGRNHIVEVAGAIEHQMLAGLLRLDCGLERTALMLLEAALENGGADNITAVFARI